MMNRDPDRVLIRAKDITLIVGILTLASIIVALAGKPMKWNEAAAAVAELRPVVAGHTTQLAVTNAKLDTILEELHDIKSDLKRQRRQP